MSYPKLLLGKVATRLNLQKSWKDISRSARPQSHGISGQTIEDFSSNWKSNIESIRTDLLNNKYRFTQYRAATIKKRGVRRDR
jgi:retron-type reverse transcriptase